MADTSSEAPAPSPDIEDILPRARELRTLLRAIVRLSAHGDPVVSHLAHMGAAISDEIANDLEVAA